MTERLKDKIAVITGGSTGIGLATATRLAQEGSWVYLMGRRQEELDRAVRAVGPRARGLQGDVSRLDDLDRLFHQVAQEKGQIDILFANAGVAETALLEDVTEEHFDKIFDINVKGLLFTVQKALPLFRSGGSIILNASIANTKGSAGFGVYGASKAAVRLFARCWTTEFKDRGIRVNTISPGPIDTPIFEGLVPAEQQKQVKEFLISRVPLGRMGKPEEIASAVAFLASADSSFITGIELFVDGGAAQV